MTEKQVSITVFTATYNRGHLLARLYNSLLDQNCPPCEWIVLDDGSTDETSQIVQGFINENKLNIIYKYTPNGGKHRAINKGVDIAKGELFFIVDSDDYLPSDSLEKISYYLQTFSPEEKKCFAGVSGLRCSHSGEIIGDIFPMKNNCHFSDMTYWELRHKHHIKGDKAEVYFTRILRKFPFPEFNGEHFLTEAVVWGAISHAGYSIRWFNYPVYVCEYQQDGLSDKLESLEFHNPQGVAHFYNLEQLCKCDYKYALYRNYNYYYYSSLSGKKMLESFRKDNNKYWACLGIPLSLIKRTIKQKK